MSELTKNTQIDLGDDLLQTKTIPYDRPGSETTAVDPRPLPFEAEASALESVEELLLNAKILMGEGLFEDAKRTLRRILRMDSSSLAARDRLEEIQKIEIKRLLGQDENAAGGGYLRGKKKKAEMLADDGEVVASALEREIGASPGTEATFFPETSDREAFQANLDQLCEGASPQDRIDLGIGFLEMEFFDTAIRMFRAAIHAEPGERRGRALLATAWIASGNGFEALLEIEALIADQSAPESERVDYGYLAGRAQDLLQNYEMAARWYRAVVQINPEYRDAEERFRRSIKLMRVKRVEGTPR